MMFQLRSASSLASRFSVGILAAVSASLGLGGAAWAGSPSLPVPSVGNAGRIFPARRLLGFLATLNCHTNRRTT